VGATSLAPESGLLRLLPLATRPPLGCSDRPDQGGCSHPSPAVPAEASCVAGGSAHLRIRDLPVLSTTPGYLPSSHPCSSTPRRSRQHPSGGDSLGFCELASSKTLPIGDAASSRLLPIRSLLPLWSLPGTQHSGQDGQAVVLPNLMSLLVLNQPVLKQQRVHGESRNVTCNYH
jgi:hypothetical protein